MFVSLAVLCQALLAGLSCCHTGGLGWGSPSWFLPMVMPTRSGGLGYLLVFRMWSPRPLLFRLCLSQKDPRGVARFPSSSCWGQRDSPACRTLLPPWQDHSLLARGGRGPGVSPTLPPASSGPQFPHL